jgi:F-type H+-transporting ATPase subunit epsilon
MKINFKIVTPQRTVLEEEVDQVSIPTKVGEVTLLPNHISYITLIAPGIVEAKNGPKVISMTVSEGFLEFHDNELTVLANTAEKAEEIDLVRAEEARKRAEKMMQEKTRLLNDEQYAAVISRVEKQTARVKLAKRYHPRTSRR